MKKLLCTVGLAICLAGCITRNPNAGKVDPATGKPFPEYVADTASISNALESARSVIRVSSPINPYASIMELAASAVAGLVLGGSALYARLKKARAVTDDLAAATVKSGSASSVLNHVTDSPHFATIASAINENTGANQNNTGEKKG